MKIKILLPFFLVNVSKIQASNISYYTKKNINYISLSGRINKNDLSKIRRIYMSIDKNKQTFIKLYSQGGDYHEGLKIGNFIRNNNIGTYVNKYCASSCAYIFTAGTYNGKPYRYIDKNALLIFHKFAYLHPNRVSQHQLIQDRNKFLNFFSLNGLYELGAKIMATPSPKFFFTLKSHFGHFVSSFELNRLNY